MRDRYWCLCGRRMLPVVRADDGVVRMRAVGWYCPHCRRWEWTGGQADD